jgi:hypothetical protein
MTAAISCQSNHHDAFLLLCHFLPDCVFTAMLSEAFQKEHLPLASLSVISSQKCTHWHFQPAPSPLCSPQVPLGQPDVLRDLVMAIPFASYGITLWLECLYLHLFVCIFQYENLSTQCAKYRTNSEDMVTHIFVKAFLRWRWPIPQFFYSRCLKWLRHAADHSPLF